jgi:hypothetical protein
MCAALKPYVSWFVGCLGGFLAGIGFFTAFILQQLKDEIDRAWAQKFIEATHLLSVTTPDSSYYLILSIEYAGIILFIVGIILVGVGGFLAYSSSSNGKRSTQRD